MCAKFIIPNLLIYIYIYGKIVKNLNMTIIDEYIYIRETT